MIEKLCTSRTDLPPGRVAIGRLSLFRRLEGYAVTRVDPLDRAVFAQPIERLVDRLAQLVVRTDHADSDVPAEIGLAFVEAEDAHRIARMGQVEIAGGARRHRRGVDLVTGDGFETVDLETEGRCRHVTPAEHHGGHRADLDPDLGVVAEAGERGEGAVSRHGEGDAGAVI